MRIAVVTQIFPTREQPYRGHSVYQTILRLQHWAEVKVFAPHAAYPDWLLPRNRMWAKTDLSFKPEGVATCYFDYPAVPVFSRPLNGRFCAARLKGLLAEYQPDVILSYWLYPDGFAAMKVGRERDVPVAVKVIGSDINAPNDWISSALGRAVLRRADVILTVTEDLRQKVLSKVPSAVVHSIPNGCNTEIFSCANRDQARRELGIDAQAEVVLYVGRLHLAKGLRELVEACAQLGKERPKLRLILVGDGPDAGKIEALIQEHNFRGRTLVAPPCPSAHVATWMTASTVCTLPSYSEGCPNTVIEALSCGRPVVGTTVGGIPDLVNPSCGVLVPPRNSSALARGLRLALESSWDSQQISAKMRRSWEQVAYETFQVCASLVQKTKRRGEISHELAPALSSR